MVEKRNIWKHIHLRSGTGKPVRDIEEILNPFHNSKEIPLGRHNARAMVDWVEKEATRLGLAEPPLLFRLEHDIPNAGAGFNRIDGRRRSVVMVTDGMLKHIFDAPNLNSSVPAGLKGILGHEMSHISDMTKGIDGYVQRKIPIYALPLLSIVGYELWRRAEERHKDDPTKTVVQHLELVTQAAGHTSQHSQDQQWNGITLDHAKRMALAGGLGLAAGIMVTTHMSLAAEFRADKASVMAAGGAQPLVDFLEKSEQVAKRIIRLQFLEWKNATSQRSFTENMGQIYKAIKHDVVASTFHKHPSNAERIQFLRKAAEEHGLPTHGV